MKNDSHEKEADSVLQWVTFRLDKERYGINVTQVREVLRLTEIAPVPGAPAYVLGIINLRGNVVTVIDTRNRVGLPSKENDESTRIVIVESDENVVGMLVDSVAEVVDLNASEIESAPNVGAEDGSTYIKGVTSINGELLILVDLNRMVAEEDLAAYTNGQG